MNPQIPPVELDIFRTLRDVKVMFDVGARTDIEYYLLRPDLEIHYFEPDPISAQTLVGGIVNNFGLSDKPSVERYYPATQSFLVRKGRHIMYRLSTLDEYAKDIPRVDFIKIDAEGMDYRILKGGKETLKKARYLQFEYWDGVRKFRDLLTDFDLYLEFEPRLYEVISQYTQDEKYKQLLVPLSEDVIQLIDEVLIPLGAGGNILAIKRVI